LSRFRAQQSQPAKPAPRTRSSLEPQAGQTIWPGLDIARDGTLILASFDGRGLLPIEPTVPPRRNLGVTGGVTRGVMRALLLLSDQAHRALPHLAT
jgi:hypothetical protein